MAKKIRVELPEYFTLAHYKKMGSFEHLDDIEKIIATITAITDYSSEEVMTWKLDDMMKVFRGIEGIIEEVRHEFYPIFTFKGQTYAFQPISKMTVGEFADIDSRIQDPISNIEELLGILYRPVKKHNFEDYTWKVKSYIKHLVGKPDELFSLYEVEDYDTTERDKRAKIFKDLPVEYALGCLSFFLQLGLQLASDSVISSQHNQEEKKELKKMVEGAMKGLQSPNIIPGYTSLETLIQQNSETLQEQEP